MHSVRFGLGLEKCDVSDVKKYVCLSNRTAKTITTRAMFCGVDFFFAQVIAYVQWIKVSGNQI